jgi:MFS family permease
MSSNRMASSFGHRVFFYAGLFSLTSSVMILEIVQTRILSVITWYHLAFFVISTSILGMAAGSVWLHLRRDRFKTEDYFGNLSKYSLVFSLFAVLALLVELTLGPEFVKSATVVIAFIELAAVLAIPFFFAGIAVSLALTRGPYPIGTVYAADLTGASLGCLGSIVVLDHFSGPSAVMVAAGLAAFASYLFSLNRNGPKRREQASLFSWARSPLGLSLVLIFLAFFNDAVEFAFRPMIVKGSVERREDIAYEKWNFMSRITAKYPVIGAPILWGGSSEAPVGKDIKETWLEIDGEAGTALVHFNGYFTEYEIYKYDLTNLAYSIRNHGDVAVIGVGGGRDVLSAKLFGCDRVLGLEINPIFTDMLTDYYLFRGEARLADIEGVELITAEARSWLTRNEIRFDCIQMSMIDTWAAASTGAFTLSENRLYTREAWRLFLSRLKDNGLFTVSRWHAPGEIDETGRLASLAAGCLLDGGVKEPGKHVFIASAAKISTLIMGRSPLSNDDIQRLKSICKALKFDVLFSPDISSSSETLSRILAATDQNSLKKATAGHWLDLSPPTDNRPFFFNMLPFNRPASIFQAIRRYFDIGGVIRGNILATITLILTLAVVGALATVFILVPLRPGIREVGKNLVWGGTAYFAVLGLGFMFVEIGLIQRLSVFLGHPVYGLALVLFSLILTAGIGSLLSERVRLDRKRIWFFIWAAGLSAYLVALPGIIRLLFSSFEGAAQLVKAALAIAVILPAGSLMGFGFPSGLSAVEGIDQRPKPWFFGINGACGVVASVLAVILSISWGIATTLYVGALCYVLLIPARILLGRGHMKQGG